MYRYLLQNKIHIALYLIFAPLSAVCSLAVSAGMAAAIDYANGGNLSDIWKYLIVFDVYILLDLATDQIFKSVRFRLVKRTMVNLRLDLYRSISRMEPRRFALKNTADFISALTSDTEILRDSYFSVLLEFYIDLLRFSLATALLFWLSPILGIFVLVTSVLQTLVPILYSKKLEAAGAKFSAAQEGHLKVLKENLSAFLTAKTFHLEEKLEGTYCGVLENAEEQKRSLKMLTVWSSNLSFVFSRIMYLGVFLLGAVLSIKGLLSAAAIVGASQLIVYISNPIYSLNSNLSQFKSSKASIKRLEAIFGEVPDTGGFEVLEKTSGTVELKNLSFGYGERKVLSNLNFTFHSGKKYLITGTSGSGKSTLLHLVAGLRSDYSGKVNLGGKELRDLSRESLTQNICYITQEPFLFDDTLYQNVCLFSDIPEDEVTEALKRVGLGDFMTALPNGIHNRIGENASAMSGGEKQRVAVARALVRGASVLLLDESTSHLDPGTAAEIERLVLGLEGVTVLLVSHNSTETAADLSDSILQIKNGSINIIK